MKPSLFRSVHNMLGIVGFLLLLGGVILVIFPSLLSPPSIARQASPQAAAPSSGALLPDSHDSSSIPASDSLRQSFDDAHAMDAGLSEAVQIAIEFTSRTNGACTIETLQTLDASACRITSLEGIEQCSSLVELDVSRNMIADLTPIASLSLLEALDLSGNAIQDSAQLKALAACHNLQSLVLSGNDIVALSPLQSLSNLCLLDLSWNRITDVTPLLENDGLGQGDIVDLRWNPLDMSEGGANRAAIQSLELRGATVLPSGDAQIVVFPDRALDAAIRDAVNQQNGHLIAENLQSLSELDAASCEIMLLEGMQHLRLLRRIDLSENAITDCSALKDLPFVYELSLQGNDIESIAPIVAIQGLSSLDLSRNEISQLGADWGARGLLVLGLAQNDIESIDAIAGLKSLRQLDVSDNHIVDISVLRGLQFLHRLALSGNMITNISALSTLNALAQIELADNQIRDISALIRCPALRGAEAFVDLRGNPLDMSAGSAARDVVNRLRARGVDVQY